MKKILLTLAGAMCLASSANAQLAEGSLFPYPGGATGGLTAVNGAFAGQRYNLDSLSSAGYTIFIDISATWCPPCWAYHNTKQLDSLWYYHGPTGMSGVSATTTNDVFVLFFQGEATSHMAELTGDYANGAIQFTTTELPYATVTQGDWTAGNSYPMIDDTTSTDANYGTGAIDAAWNIAFFPTVYMVCRDHLVHNLTQPSYTDAYAAAQAGCPNYAPSATINAKAIPYLGNSYFDCTASPSVTFQNYSATNPITAATITVKDASNAVVATAPWTGNLAPYNTATVAVPGFTPTSFGGYKYTVTVAGDSYPADDNSADSLFKVYSSVNAGTLPFYDDLTGAISYKYNFPTDGSIGLPNPDWSGAPGPTGTVTNRFLLFDFYDIQAGSGLFDFVVGNFNTDGYSNMTFEFDESYALYTGNASDNMYVKVSKDCGATWSTVWTGTGATLSTAASTTSEWVPTAASDWAHRTVNIPVTDTGNNMIVKLTGTSAYGNYAWVTDLKMSGHTTGVAQVIANNEISIAPNPAKDVANVSMSLTQAANVQIDVLDAVGRVVSTVNQQCAAGTQKIEVSTANLAAGFYNVKITANGNMVVKQLSVIK